MIGADIFGSTDRNYGAGLGANHERKWGIETGIELNGSEAVSVNLPEESSALPSALSGIPALDRGFDLYRERLFARGYAPRICLTLRGADSLRRDSSCDRVSCA